MRPRAASGATPDASRVPRYTLSARLSRNLTLGLTYAGGDIRRNLSFGQEVAAVANIKF